MGIDEYDNYQDANVRIIENSKGVCFQQREENECGFFSTISVLISLIKKYNGRCDDKFLEYLSKNNVKKQDYYIKSLKEIKKFTFKHHDRCI